MQKWGVYTGKFLGTPRVWRNGASSSHIHGGPYHEFNEQTRPWMWDFGSTIPRISGVPKNYSFTQSI